jgi:hypothetical protein
MTDPRELIADARKLGDPMSETSLYHQLADALEKALRENVCDSCAGDGQSLDGGSCMCLGTGKMSEAAGYLREQLVAREAECKRLREALSGSRVLLDQAGDVLELERGPESVAVQKIRGQVVLIDDALGKDGGT